MLTQMLVGMPSFFLPGALCPLRSLAPAWLTVLTRVRPNHHGLRKKGDAGWLRGQTTRRRYHRRSDGGPERRQRCPDGGPEHRYEWYTPGSLYFKT